MARSKDLEAISDAINIAWRSFCWEQKLEDEIELYFWRWLS